MKRTIRLVENNILGQETADEKIAKADSIEKGLYSESEENSINTLNKGDVFENANGVQITIIDVDKEHLLDGEPQVTYRFEDSKNIKCYRQSSVIDMLNQNHYKKVKGLTEDIDTGKDEENDTADEIADDLQDETPAEEEEKSSKLDTQLEDLREVLPDLDLNLYQVTNKEDTNKIFYFIGKVADDTNDVLMLVDNNPTEDEDEPSKIDDELPIDEDVKEIDNSELNDDIESSNSEESDESEENRFDFVIIPSSYDDLAKMNPRYGDELNPDHEAIMEYLMKCLIEKSPEKAEELSSEKDVDDGTKIPLDADVQADIDNKIEHYSKNLNK